MINWKDIIGFTKNGNPPADKRVSKSEQEWQQQLTPEQYFVAREKGTERPFLSPMCNIFEAGIYSCVCCDTELFDSSEKFQSGTGWPSFVQPIKSNAVVYHADGTHGIKRIEATCNTCDAHLGHVFADGPDPSGLRYCINAIVIQKK